MGQQQADCPAQGAHLSAAGPAESVGHATYHLLITPQPAERLFEWKDISSLNLSQIASTN